MKCIFVGATGRSPETSRENKLDFINTPRTGDLPVARTGAGIQLSTVKKTSAPAEAFPGLPMLRLAGRAVLVVGGDAAAAQAADVLVRCGASVKLLSPELSARAKALVKAGAV